MARLDPAPADVGQDRSPARARNGQGRPLSRLAAGLGGARDLRRLVWSAPAFVFLGVFFLYPMVLLVEMSLHEVSIGSVGRGDNPWVGLDNFRAVLESDDFRSAVPRTAIFVSAAVLLELLLGLALAVVLNARLPGVHVGRLLVFFVWLLPPVVTGGIWKFVIQGTEEGFLNHVLTGVGLLSEPYVFLTDSTVAMTAITLITAWAGVPFVAIVLMAALQNIPEDVYEAARVDGASPARRFASVTVPFLVPTLSILAVLLTIYAFKAFDFIYVLTNGGPGTSTSTVPFLAYTLSFAQYDFGQGAALAVFAVVASVILSSPYVLRARREEVY